MHDDSTSVERLHVCDEDSRSAIRKYSRLRRNGEGKLSKEWRAPPFCVRYSHIMLITISWLVFVLPFFQGPNSWQDRVALFVPLP